MSPEQALGKDVDVRADVYALGAILFELLALEPLNGGDGGEETIALTLEGTDSRPSRRAPDRGIPPELDAICEKATRLDPEDRHASALELSRAIERYLEGDRDTARRREVADEHVQRARAALERLRSNPAAGEADRGAILRELNAALALDSENEDAMAALLETLTDVPPQFPPEAEAELRTELMHQRRRSSRASSLSFLAIVAFAPIMTWMGVRDEAALLSISVFAVAASAMTWWMGARGHTSNRHYIVLMVMLAVLGASSSFLLGPFIVAPTLVLAFVLTVILNMRAGGMTRTFIVLISLLAIVLPALAQVAGIAPSSYAFRDGLLVVKPWAVAFPEKPTLAFLLVSTASLMAIPALAVGRSVDALVQAERRLAFQAWRLRQLLPERTRASRMQQAGGHAATEAQARSRDSPEIW